MKRGLWLECSLQGRGLGKTWGIDIGRLLSVRGLWVSMDFVIR